VFVWDTVGFSIPPVNWRAMFNRPPGRGLSRNYLSESPRRGFKPALIPALPTQTGGEKSFREESRKCSAHVLSRCGEQKTPVQLSV
jgi:hypothetical protein